MKLQPWIIGLAALAWATLARPGFQVSDESPGAKSVLGGALPVQRLKPLFGKFFSKPTGRNGMEDYIAAADRVSSSTYRGLDPWITAHRALQNGEALNQEEKRALAALPFGDPAKATPLEASRIALRGLTDVRELVLQGNRKPVYSLHPELDFDTTFPEFSRLKSLARFLATEASIAFADGNSASGTDTLLAALTMAGRLPQDASIGRLVSNSMGAIVLAEFERRLGQLSAKDVAKVLASLDEQLDGRNAFLESLHSELSAVEASLKAMAAGKSFEGLPRVPEDLKLPESETRRFDRKAFFDSVHGRIVAWFQSFVEVLGGPEGQWFHELKARGFKREPPPLSRPKKLADAEIMVAEFFTENLPEVAFAEARNRTILHLLRLHMRVLAYKWAEGRLPDRLDQAAPAAEIQDVFAGGTFQYVPDAYGHYQLFSVGFAPYGRIDLKYRPDPSAPKADPGDIPPERAQP